MKNLETAIKIASCSIFGLYLKAHHTHLNITGADFYQYHKLTDKIWKDLIESFDGISEQIRALDIYAPASLGEIEQLSVVYDQPDILPADQMIYELLIDNDKVIQVLIETNTLAANHPGLQNFIEGRIDQHEKWGWMLRATVQ